MSCFILKQLFLFSVFSPYTFREIPNIQNMNLI